MPIPERSHDERAGLIARIDAIVTVTSKRIPPIPSMAEFDAQEYDARGSPR